MVTTGVLPSMNKQTTNSMKFIKSLLKYTFIVLLLFLFNNSYGQQPTACIISPSVDTIKCRWTTITLEAANCSNPTSTNVSFSWVNLDHPNYILGTAPYYTGKMHSTRDSGRWEVTVTNTIDMSTDKDTVHISYKPEPSPEFSINNQAFFVGKCTNTTAVLNATTGANIINYNWYSAGDNTSIGTTNTISISTLPLATDYLVNATYTVTGCMLIDSIYVTNFLEPTPELGNDTAICKGQSITLKIDSLKAGTYTYAWITPSTFGSIDTYFIPNTVTNSGRYRVWVKGPDSYPCIISDSIFVTIDSLPILNSASDSLICFGDSITLDAPIVTAATGTFSYKWSPNTSINDVTLPSPTVKPTSDITYTVAAKATSGCIGYETRKIIVNPQITASVLFSDTTVCPGSSIMLKANASGGTVPFTYSWTPNTTIDDDSIPAPMVNPLSPIKYVVIMKDAKNCSKKDSVNIDILKVDILGDKDTLGTIGTPLLLDAYNSTTNGFSFLWKEDKSGTNLGTSPTLSVNSSGVYVVSVYNGSCMVTDTIEAIFYTEIIQSVWLPNAFNPTLSQLDNSHLRVYGNNISNQDFLFRVYNQWGKLIYETSNLVEAQDKGWNGMENNTGKELSSGVYTYTVKGQHFDGKTFDKAGMVNLIR